ncbi:MAG: glycosyltransferase, partial [Planctomycetes bacterium]|nr:glycosyltransferase [Planctomycetota bacterium]
VYECAEEWDAYETDPLNKQHIREMDEALCRAADVVFVPSRELLKRKSPQNPSTYLAPWGVDLELYARARDPATPIPADVRSLPRPIIGMFGMLDGRRLHTELLRHLAVQHPDWSIVLVGRCMPNLDRSSLDPLPNVRFLGMRPVEQIPAYCKAFDVCMIPYMLNEFTRSIMPLKIAEYLATGKPVVSTELPAAVEMSDVIHVARDIPEFEQHLCAALAERPELSARRVARAQDFDWDVLMRQRMAWVAPHLNGMHAAAGRPGPIQGDGCAAGG